MVSIAPAWHCVIPVKRLKFRARVSDGNLVERRFHPDDPDAGAPCVPCRHCWEHQPLERDRIDIKEGRAWHRCRVCQDWYLVRWEDAVAVMATPAQGA
jgi:hypothetical protein